MKSKCNFDFKFKNPPKHVLARRPLVGGILFAALRANQALAGTVVVAITFTFLTGVKLVITEGLPAWDHSDDESIRKKNLLTYAFLIAPAVAPIVYMWGVL